MKAPQRNTTHFRLNRRNVTRGGTKKGDKSSLEARNYALRVGRYANQKDALIYYEAGNLPGFANGDDATYWAAADKFEHSRIDTRIATKFQLSIPLELESVDDRIALAKSFVNEWCNELVPGNGKLPYLMAIHEGSGPGGEPGHNPHIHLIVSERIVDDMSQDANPETFFRRWTKRANGDLVHAARKPEGWSTSKQSGDLMRMRESWRKHIEIAFEKAGIEVNVDERSNQARGLPKPRPWLPREEWEAQNAEKKATKARAREEELQRRRDEHERKLAKQNAAWQASVEAIEHARLLEILAAAEDDALPSFAEQDALAYPVGDVDFTDESIRAADDDTGPALS
jgi:hypothetical protein